MEISQNNQSEMINIFKVLGNQTRLSILILLENQELSVTDIVNRLELTQPQISHQLAILKEYQLVNSKKVGKQNFYWLDDPHILNVINATKNHVKHVIKGEQHNKN